MLKAMLFPEWEKTYLEIISDFGFDRESDESSARMLKAVTMNSDLETDDILNEMIGETVTVIGNGPDLEMSLKEENIHGMIICSGSAVERVMASGIVPDIVVTDLDGAISPQIKSNLMGSVTLLHAHGDNSHLIQRYASEFKGPVILTTQSVPDNIISNYGGFTDGDRAVCVARHFGAKEIFLIGFDFERPYLKDGTDPEIKKRKLAWAKRIIFDMNCPDVKINVIH